MTAPSTVVTTFGDFLVPFLPSFLHVFISRQGPLIGKGFGEVKTNVKEGVFFFCVFYISGLGGLLLASFAFGGGMCSAFL